MNTKNKDKIYLIYLYLITFYIIFTPTINTFGSYTKYFVLLIIWLTEITMRIVIYKKQFINNIINELTNKKCIKYFIVILIAQIYYIVAVTANNHPENLRLLQFGFTLVNYSLVIFINNDLNRIGYSALKKKKFIINIFCFQSAVCILMIIFPFLKNIANYLYISNGNDNYFVINTRVYGITSDYTFGLPIISALIAGVILFDEDIGNTKFKYSIFCFIPALLNSRTGLFIYIIFGISYIITNIKNKRDLMKTIKILFLLLIVLGLFFLAVPTIHKFILTGFYDFINLLQGKLTGNFEVLLKKMLYFPKNIFGLIFGLGIRVFGGNGIKYGYYPSDIGYVNDIFMGGIIYSILLYVSLYFITKKDNKKIFWILIVSFMIINFKGELFRSTYILTTIYIIYMLFNNEKTEKNKDDDLISVICPMYNVENYIDECIDSIMKNTYKNIELILIDDGSTDGTVSRAISFQSKYNNIIVLKQENKGAPTARNLGIEKSKGKYIILFDSDDIMEQTFIEDMHNEINNNDFAFSNYTYIDQIKNTSEFRNVTNKYNPFDIKSLYFLDPFPNNKIFKSDIIKNNNIKFDNVRIAQDLNFYLKYLKYVKNAGYSKRNGSFYRIHSSGISRTYTLKILEIENAINSTKSENYNNNEYKLLKLEHYYAQMTKISHYDLESKKIIKEYFKGLICEQKLYLNKYVFRTMKYLLGIIYYMVK